MRGSGNSGGLIHDEYEEQELSDAIEIIEWLANQPWSNGSVAMYGKSWGGFNGLQVAALQPPALKAVISLYSTDNRFTDDVHYIGDTVLGNYMLSWSTTMLGYLARPPSPKYNANWKQEWKNRLQNLKPWVTKWLQHQQFDKYCISLNTLVLNFRLNRMKHCLNL